MDFPEHIKRALEALGDKSRRKILLSLEPPNTLTYSEIRALLKEDLSSKGTVTYHIHKLESAGLISNYIAIDSNERERSFYSATPLCKDLISAIFNIYEGRNNAIDMLTFPQYSNTMDFMSSTFYNGEPNIFSSGTASSGIQKQQKAVLPPCR